MPRDVSWRLLFDARCLVPSAILVFVAAYWYQAARLSEGARLFPAMVTIALLATLLATLFNALRHGLSQREDEVSDAESGGNLLRTIFVLGNVGCLLLWSVLGAPIGLFLGMAFSMYIFGARKPLILLVVPAVSAACLYLIFAFALETRLPLGSLFTSFLSR